jgi:hypothetical protein
MRLALALLLLGTQAAALRCLPPDPMRSFLMAQGDVESWIVLRGALTYDDVADIEQDAVPARLTGYSLGQDGFDVPFDGPLRLVPDCVGSFCGGLPERSDYLIFARRGADGSYTTPLNPCGQWILPDPGARTIAAIVACYAGRSCEPDQTR